MANIKKTNSKYQVLKMVEKNRTHGIDKLLPLL